MNEYKITLDGDTIRVRMSDDKMVEFIERCIDLCVFPEIIVKGYWPIYAFSWFGLVWVTYNEYTSDYFRF